MSEVNIITMADASQDTHTGDTSWSYEKQIDSANIPAGDYLVLWSGMVAGSSTSNGDNFECQLFNGASAIGASYQRFRPWAVYPEHLMWNGVTKVTMNGSNSLRVGIKLQTVNTDTIYLSQMYIAMIPVDDTDTAADALHSGDYRYSDSETDVNTDPADAWYDLESITLGNGEDDWLVFGYIRAEHGTISHLTRQRFVMDGTPGDEDISQACWNDAGNVQSSFIMTTMSAPASQTVKHQVYSDLTLGGANYNSIAAIRLNAFDDYAFTHLTPSSGNEITPADTDVYYTLTHTTNHTSAAAEDWLFLGWSEVHWPDDSKRIDTYMDQAGTDIAGDHTGTYGIIRAKNNNEDSGHFLVAPRNMAHNTDVDVDFGHQEEGDVTPASTIDVVTIVGFTFEKAPPGATINRVLKSSTVVTDPIPGYQLYQERPANSNVELLTDAAFLYYCYARLVVEYFPLVDAYIMEQQLRRDLSDVASITDAISVIDTRFRETVDSLTVSDGYIKDVIIGEVGTVYNRLRTDSFALDDNVIAAFYGTTDRQLDDSLLVNEAAFLQRFKRHDVADQIAIVSELLNLTHGKVKKDFFKMTDSVVITEYRTRSVTVLDSFSLVDSIAKQVTGVAERTLVDVIDVIDTDWWLRGTTLKPPVPIETGIEER